MSPKGLTRNELETGNPAGKSELAGKEILSEFPFHFVADTEITI